MEHDRQIVEADLRGLVDGETRCDKLFCQMYASDASIYESPPLGVVRPRDAQDVAACVQYAAENEISIHARGAGTGLAGQAIGPGLVVDFSHHMRRMVVDDGDTVRVQPGVVLSQLNRYLAPAGRIFGPDPSTADVTTMGSVMALDGSGSLWPHYGSARDQIVSAQIVLADGTIMEATRRPPPQTPPERDENGELAGPKAHAEDLMWRLGRLLEQEANLIEQCRPKTAVNCSGYQLHDVLIDGRIDLPRMLVGSEGTLALFTEITLKTAPLPKHRGVGLLFFDRLDAAARGALQVRRMGVAACDLLDRRLLSIARESDPRYDLLLPAEAEAMLLVELLGDDLADVRDRLHKVVDRLRRKKLAFDARTSMDNEECDFYRNLTRRVIPMLYRLEGASRPLPFVEDIAVPPEDLPAFLVELQNVLKTHQVTASMFAHAGHGQLHVRPFLNLSDQRDVAKMRDLSAALYEKVLQVGGVVSGEHGDGLSRSWFLRKQFGPLYDVFRRVKSIFDPRAVFNPGKVVTDSPMSVDEHLRPVQQRFQVAPSDDDLDNGAPENGEQIVPLQLKWSADEATLAARLCNGCGSCRTTSPDERMCPIFRFSPGEEASPRAKANLMRGVLTGALKPTVLATEELKQIADLCVHCHQCRIECPARVDIPKLMMESKAQYVATNGLRGADWFINRLESLSRLGSALSPLANWALGNRQMRWLLERLTGIAQGRKLPRFTARNFLRRASQRRLTKPTRDEGSKVLYFVDLYANWHDVQLAEALVAVLEHNGVSVYVPVGQLPSGMPSIAMGSLDRARQLAQRNVELLAEAVRQGYSIVATEPAAALALAHEYPKILDEDDARLVAANTHEACAYLWRMHQTGKLELDLKPVNAVVGYHQPCMSRALGGGSPGEHLLRLIPGLQVQTIERGCSGMAGAWGLKRENYRSSLRAGWGLISALRNPAVQVGATECSTCKMQMEQGVSKPTIHPLKVLALAYGLMPEVASQLTSRGEDLTVT